jgi:hypothetical protein
MTREEHLQWCKERAIQEMDYYFDASKGVVSMMSDLGKHPETNSQVLITLCMAQLLRPKMNRQQMIDFLDGFR